MSVTQKPYDLSWMVTIVNRGRVDKIKAFFTEHGIRHQFVLDGHGSARKEVLDYLGLVKQDKELLFSLVPSFWVSELQQTLTDKIHFYKPGRGIMFAIDISGLNQSLYESSGVAALCEERENVLELEKEHKKRAMESQFEMVVFMALQGQKELLMHYVREAGARGGTYISTKDLSDEGRAVIGNMEVFAEKDAIIVITKREQKNELMSFVCNNMMQETGAKVSAFSMPVNSCLGLASDSETKEN